MRWLCDSMVNNRLFCAVVVGVVREQINIYHRWFFVYIYTAKTIKKLHWHVEEEEQIR